MNPMVDFHRRHVCLLRKLDLRHPVLVHRLPQSVSKRRSRTGIADSDCPRGSRFSIKVGWHDRLRRSVRRMNPARDWRSFTHEAVGWLVDCQMPAFLQSSHKRMLVLTEAVPVFALIDCGAKAFERIILEQVAAAGATAPRFVFIFFWCFHSCIRLRPALPRRGAALGVLAKMIFLRPSKFFIWMLFFVF